MKLPITVLPKFAPKQFLAIDTETTGLEPFKNDRPFAVGMCDEDGNTWYCKWQVDPFTRKVIVDQKDIEFIQRYCNGDFDLIFHNANFDVRMLELIGITIPYNKVQDTYIQARVFNNIELTNELKPLAYKYIKIQNTDEKDLRDAADKARRLARTFNRTSDDKILLHEEIAADYWLVNFFDKYNTLCEEYCRMDTVRTICLYRFYSKRIAADWRLQKAYNEEMEIWPIIYKMIGRGVRINKDLVIEEIHRAEAAKDHHMAAMLEIILEKSLRPFIGVLKSPEEFNPNSPKQLIRVLYLSEKEGGLGLSTERRTDTGQLSADAKALDELMWHPFVRNLKGFKAAGHVLGQFLEKYLDLMVLDKKEYILHPGINQCGADTFRKSCANPNLQNVPNPDASNAIGEKYEARKPFGPREGYVWVGFDFEQQELRLFTIYGNIPFFLQEMRAGNDVYSALANKVWGNDKHNSLVAASKALDLGLEKPSNEETALVWEEYDWDFEKARQFGYESIQSLAIAKDWFSNFNYKIVEAEASIGKKNSRNRGKIVLLSKSYGAGVSSIAGTLMCKPEEARIHVAEIDREVPEVSAAIKRFMSMAAQDGYVINPYDRVVKVDLDLSYKACNYFIQSTAAVMLKKAMVNVNNYTKKVKLDVNQVLPIHDELILEIRKEHCYPWFLSGVVECMVNTGVDFIIPMSIDVNLMRNSWQDKEKVEL